MAVVKGHKSTQEKYSHTKKIREDAKNTTRRTIYRSNRTTVRKTAISDIENKGTIYILGGNPAYIHSRAEYFKAGLKVAEQSFNKMLSHLINEQKNLMVKKAHIIDQMWQTKLHNAFGNSISTFQDFKSWWDKAIMNKQEPSEFFSRLEPLLKLKEAKVRKNALDTLRSEIRSSLKKQTDLTAQQKAEKMNDALSPYHMSVTVNTKNNNMTYGGLGKELEKEWDRIIRDNTRLAWLNPEDSADAQVISELSEKQLAALTSGDSIKDTTIGHLFELRSVGIYKNIQHHLPEFENQFVDLIVENVAGEKTGQDTKKFKADSKISFNLNGEVMFDFFTSDKASQRILYGLQDMTTAPIIEQFTASLNSDTLNFMNYNIDSSSLFTNHSMMQRIFNYVFTNYAAFNINIQDFKESVVLYAAWLKICSEIIGETSIQTMPMAIRTLKTIYNTADLLRLFINLNPYDMFKYLRQSDLKSGFFKKNYTLTPIERQNLFIEKKLALLSMVDNKEHIDYNTLYNNSAIQSYLKNIGAHIKKPALHTSFVIKLTNLQI